jgi:hypothetical protein
MNTLTQDIKLFFTDKQFRVGQLTVDALVKESHELRSQITEHPTESGESFCDHVINLPITIQLEGVISNTPLTFIGVTTVNSIANHIKNRSNNMAELAFKMLEEIFSKRTPISISTSLKDYDNMVLESLSIEREGSSTQSLHFKATAKEIRVVNLETIKINTPAPKPERAKPKQRLGKQETKPASQEIKAKVKQKSSVIMFGGKWVVSKAKNLFGW